MTTPLFESDQRPPRKNERNEPFEALADATGTDWKTGRGELNKALLLIRRQAGDVSDTELAAEISVRARRYHHLMPGMMLTPSALAKHWQRIKPPRTEPTVAKDPCSTCDDLLLIVADVREDGSEEYRRCPACCPQT